MQSIDALEKENRSLNVLTPRSDMTDADRAWAARYQAGDVLHYIRGSKEHAIKGGSYAQVVTTIPSDNLVTVRKSDGQIVTCDPSRLRGISAYREIEREFAVGDRVQLTAPNRDLQVANRVSIEDPPLDLAATHERTVAHRLAIELERRFPVWNVDCEYNRDGDLLYKFLDGLALCDEQKRTDRVFPDIILHKRRAVGRNNNLLVVEIKRNDPL